MYFLFLNCIAGAKDSAAAEDDLFRGSLGYGMEQESLAVSKKRRRDFGHAVFLIGILLYKLLFIDNKLKLQPQLFSGLAAENHALHKDFKVFHNGAILGING